MVEDGKADWGRCARGGLFALLAGHLALSAVKVGPPAGGGGGADDMESPGGGAGGLPLSLEPLGILPAPEALSGEGAAVEGRVVFQATPGFDGSGTDAPPPVCFTGAEGAAVRVVMASVCGEVADLATLADVTAPYSRDTARLRAAEGGGAAPAMTAAEAALAAQFCLPHRGPEEWRVVALEFGAPVPLECLCFGDTAGRAAWGRRWRGGIGDVVCFDAPPSDDARAGVASWLAARRGAGRHHPATAAQRRAAADAGLKYGVAWSTLIIVR